MLRLSSRQRLLLAEKALDTANLAIGALVFGQFVANQVFSYKVAFFGFMAWLVLLGCSLFLSGKD